MFALSIMPLLVPPSHAIVPRLSSSSSVPFGKSDVSALPTNSPESESDSEGLSSHPLSILRCCPPCRLRLTPFQFPCLCEVHIKFQLIFDELYFELISRLVEFRTYRHPTRGEAFLYLICIIYPRARPSMLFWAEIFEVPIFF